jgi:O-glycosyl hydrolase
MVVAGLLALFAASADAQVVIDVDVRHQVMQGFGASHRTWDDPHVSKPHGHAEPTVIPPTAQHEILKQLYTDLGLTRVRPTIGPGIQRPLIFKLSRFDFSGRKNDDNIAFVKQAMPYGLRTVWLSPIALESWMNERNPDEYVEWALAVLLRWRQLGVELPFYSPLNEPGHSLHKPPLSGQWLTQVVKRLGPRMRAEGLKTMLVIPDDIDPKSAYQRALPVMEDPDARPYVGAVAYHLYGGSAHEQIAIRDLALKYGIPVWMSEYSEPSYATYAGALGWARTIHDLITTYGASAVDYLAGFFGGWQEHGAHTLIPIDFKGSTYRAHRLSAAYYLTGQYSRFVRPGDVRVDVRASPDGVLISAFKGPADIVAVLINPTSQARTIDISVLGVPAVGRVQGTRTSPTEQWQDLPGIVVPGTRFGAMLPPQSVTTLVLTPSE